MTTTTPRQQRRSGSTDLSGRVLTELQSNFPLEVHPYEALAGTRHQRLSGARGDRGRPSVGAAAPDQRDLR